MHSFIELLVLLALIPWKVVNNLFYGTEIALYLILRVRTRDEVSHALLGTLESGKGWGQVYTVLWWDWRWARSLVQQHERRQRLKDAWR